MKKKKIIGSYQYSFSVSRRNVWQLFFMYACALLYVVFLTPNRYEGGHPKSHFVPIVSTVQRFHKPPREHFWSYYIEYWGNLFGNILLFMPFGFLLSYLFSKASHIQLMLAGFVASCCIESVQYLLQIGVCDVDDVVLNTLGTIAGIAVFKRQRFLKVE